MFFNLSQLMCFYFLQNVFYTKLLQLHLGTEGLVDLETPSCLRFFQKCGFGTFISNPLDVLRKFKHLKLNIAIDD